MPSTAWRSRPTAGGLPRAVPTRPSDCGRRRSANRRGEKGTFLFCDTQGRKIGMPPVHTLPPLLLGLVSSVRSVSQLLFAGPAKAGEEVAMTTRRQFLVRAAGCVGAAAFGFGLRAAESAGKDEFGPATVIEGKPRD